MRMVLVMVAASMLTGCMTAQGDAGSNSNVTPDGVAEREELAVPVCPTETRNWRAWLSALPGPDAQRTLVIEGEALLPEQSHATLVAGPTDRMQPPGQRMKLAVERSDAAAGWQSLRAEIAPALPAYSSIVIGCDGAEVARLTDIPAAQ